MDILHICVYGIDDYAIHKRCKLFVWNVINRRSQRHFTLNRWKFQNQSQAIENLCANRGVYCISFEHTTVEYFINQTWKFVFFLFFFLWFQNCEHHIECIPANIHDILSANPSHIVLCYAAHSVGNSWVFYAQIYTRGRIDKLISLWLFSHTVEIMEWHWYFWL